MAKKLKTPWGMLTVFDGKYDPEKYETEEETVRRLHSMGRVLTSTLDYLKKTSKKCSQTSKKIMDITASLTKTAKRLNDLED